LCYFYGLWFSYDLGVVGCLKEWLMDKLDRKPAGRALAVVVGAGGMGLAVARRLGQQYRLLLVDMNSELLDNLTAELTAEGCDVKSAVCDVTDPADIEQLSKKIGEQGGFRVLAHVVGLSPSMADWQTIMAVNLLGPTLIANALLPLANVNSVALFVTSLAAHMVDPEEQMLAVLDQPLAANFFERLITVWGKELSTTESYSLSKSAVVRMCERQASPWGQKQARIVSVSPGLIATPMGLLEFKNQPQKMHLLEKTPLERQGSLHEIVDAIEFLVSDKASFISGTNLLVDGGIKAALTHG
jgi:NAD(P)-dependent dehydrogenase (short-subunit alcohol dehydrogenase family)